MKKSVYIYYCLLIALLPGSMLHAQTILEKLRTSFDAYRAKHIQEKLFVHTDKQFYLSGEIIWFKIYATDAHTNQPLDFSRIGYVEILNKEHKPVLQAKIALVDGSGNGSFQLPYSVNTGNYILRAYTNWMKNESAEYFFEKDIIIVNALKKPEWAASEAPAYDVQFFPEGGNMVNGIQSKIAFKVVDANGKSSNCNGAIVNRRNDTIVRFSSLRFGMGHFMLTPDAAEEYRAVVRTGDGKTITKLLPAVHVSGMVMHLTEQSNNKLLLSIQSKNAGSVVSLLVHTRQMPKLSVARELFNNSTEVEIDKKDLGDGIIHFTVFNASGEPVCERLYFKRPESLTIEAKPGAQQFGPRKKVTVDIATYDSKQQLLPGNLSMSVFRLDSLQSLETGDIQSYLWLQSDLRGSIESPGYYFTEQGAEAIEAADNLVLTQGWRRFRWENVLQQQTSTTDYLPETEGHIINGRIIDKRNGQGIENAMAFLSVPNEKSLFTNSISGKNGAIRFNIKNFYGGNAIVVQTNNSTDSNYRVDISNPFSEKYSERTYPLFLLHEKTAGLLRSHSLQSQVGNAYFSDKQQNFLFPKAIDTTAFYGIPDKRYYLDDYTRFITMEEVMREYVQDVRVRKTDDHFNFRVRNEAFNNFFETAPLVLFDGVPEFDMDKIIAFDPLKIKRIDVVAKKYYQHSMVHDGIISYSTYQGDLAGFPLHANALIVDYEGLQLQREFYSPVYETVNNNRLPDFRNVLYWSPDVHTDKTGRKQVSFYTADVPGTYAVVVQGITANGLAGSKATTFTVAN